MVGFLFVTNLVLFFDSNECNKFLSLSFSVFNRSIYDISHQENSSQDLLHSRQQVMLDSDLADLYGITTKLLNEQVKRNFERFLEDFMFQLSTEEYEVLRSQFRLTFRS